MPWSDALWRALGCRRLLRALGYRGKMLRKFVYIQLYRGHFFARVVGETHDIRFDCAGMDHPRSLFGDHEGIRSAFAAALRHLNAFRFGFIKPAALVHLIPHAEGGYTHAELRAFRLAAEEAGVGRIFLLNDKEGPASDDTLRQIFPGIWA